MDITTLFTYALGAFILFLIVGWLGFLIPPKPLQLTEEVLPATPPLPFPESLPPALASALSPAVGSPATLTGALAAWGTGKIIARRFPIVGPLWAPMTWKISLVPGQGFIWDSTITWFGRPFLPGHEEFVDGKGKFVVKGSAIDTEHIHRSEQVMLFLYSFLLAPAFFLNDERFTWKEGEEDAIQLEVALGDNRPMTFTLFFDPQNHNLIRIETFRPTSRTGKDIPFQVKFSKNRRFSDQLTLPGRIDLAWQNDFYLFYEPQGILYDADILPLVKEAAE
jgi:hypothetical protein